jgi:ParB-like nuclease domain
MEPETRLTVLFPRSRLYKCARKRIQSDEADLYSVPLDHPLCNLRPHPLSIKLYGDSEPDAALIESIRQVGIQNPIIVNEEGEILSGNRRYKAYRLLHEADPRKFSGHLTVRLGGVGGLDDERAVIYNNIQRVKTKGQIAREAAALLRIEKALAAERASAGKKPRVSLHKGRATKIVGEKLGLSERTAEKAAAVADAAENGNEIAIAALGKLDRNEGSISAAFQKIVKPPKDTDAIAAHDAAAKSFTGMFSDAGIDGQVSRAKDAERFHVVLRNLTAAQVEEICERYKERAA